MLVPEKWHMIRKMREKGMIISEIARQMHMSRNTVKKHLRLDKPLEYKRKRRKSKLDHEKRRESNINKLTLWYLQKKIKGGKRIKAYRGYFVDLKTLTFALTDKQLTLDSACESSNVSRKKHTEEHGKITKEYIDYRRFLIVLDPIGFGQHEHVEFLE
jgi:orotate phosphoribosyltransferase-like protein